MNELKTLALEELLERNNITKIDFMNETYKCMLISIFETIVLEIKHSDIKNQIKQRYLNSSNKVITTQRLVYEKTKCRLDLEESEIIYKYLHAFFTKNNVRKKYDNLIRNKLLNYQENRCNICKRHIENFSAELDHIIPWTLVGDQLGTSNLQMLCKDCNTRKSKNAAYNLKMFLVSK